jgi:hypothetical protein
MRDEDAGKITVPTGLSLCLPLSLCLYLYLFLSLARSRSENTVSTGGIVPKVTMRGKADKLFCNYEDEPSQLEAPTGVRRGNRVWPAHWYQSRTVANGEAVDPDKHLSIPDILRVQEIFKQMSAVKDKEDRQREAKTEEAAVHLKHARTAFHTMSFANLLDVEKQDAVVR